MFTGIVQGLFPVLAIEDKPGLRILSIGLPARLRNNLTTGASIAVNGVCLTVTAISGDEVSFDLMQQTLDTTNLGQLVAGNEVNIERSACQGAEIGGHILSGHVDTLGTIVAVDRSTNNCFVTYDMPPRFMKYIFDRGFIGLDGCSLTVASVDQSTHRFTVCFIPETLRMTTHGRKGPGETVNLEIDRQTQTIVDTVERVLSRQGKG